jgi:hypothetical protein
MFEVPVPTHPAKSGLFHTPRAKANPAAGVAGAVNPSQVAVFAHLDRQTIRCLSGHLWVTLENDPMDHVLKQNQRLFVTTGGKVVIGGRGRYCI